MAHSRYAGLTFCELAALECVAQGLSDKESAKVLGKDWLTVQDQVQAAVKKLGARNRPHAVALLLAPDRQAS